MLCMCRWTPIHIRFAGGIRSLWSVQHESEWSSMSLLIKFELSLCYFQFTIITVFKVNTLNKRRNFTCTRESCSEGRSKWVSSESKYKGCNGIEERSTFLTLSLTFLVKNLVHEVRRHGSLVVVFSSCLSWKLTLKSNEWKYSIISRWKHNSVSAFACTSMVFELIQKICEFKPQKVIWILSFRQTRKETKQKWKILTMKRDDSFSVADATAAPKSDGHSICDCFFFFFWLKATKGIQCDAVHAQGRGSGRDCFVHYILYIWNAHQCRFGAGATPYLRPKSNLNYLFWKKTLKYLLNENRRIFNKFTDLVPA